MKKQYLLFILLNFILSGALAHSEACPSSDRASEQLIEKLLSPMPSSEERDFLRQDLRCLAQIRGRNHVSELHQKIFGSKADGRLYLRWLSQRVTQLKFDPDLMFSAVAGSPSEKDVARRLLRPIKNADSLTVGLSYLNLDDRWERLSILLHEARHNDGLLHDLLQEPKGKGKICGDGLPCVGALEAGNVQFLAVDKKADGPYGVEAIFCMNVAKTCSHCSENDILSLRSCAIRAFNNIPDAKIRNILSQDLFDQADQFWIIDLLQKNLKLTPEQ